MKLLHFWPGNHEFLFNGKFIVGNIRDRKIKCMTVFIIIAIYFLYLALPNSYIYRRVNTWLPWLTNYLFCTTMLFMLLASGSDPGLLPPRQFL
jgi:hypothetical protein